MHTDSSAIATCLRLRSTVECTATVRMPRAWHARRMRSAISPRLAITTLSSIARASADHEQWLVELNRLAALALDRERSEEHTSELQSLMRISYAVFCLKKKQKIENTQI